MLLEGYDFIICFNMFRVYINDSGLRIDTPNAENLKQQTYN